MNYESKRIHINFLAVQEICKYFGFPSDAPPKALGSAVEKLIFQRLSATSSPPTTNLQQQSLPTIQPNKTALVAMLKK